MMSKTTERLLFQQKGADPAEQSVPNLLVCLVNVSQK